MHLCSKHTNNISVKKTFIFRHVKLHLRLYHVKQTMNMPIVLFPKMNQNQEGT